MKIKSTIIASLIAISPFCLSAQVTLPTAAVLKKNKVKEVIVFQHNLPSVYIDSTQKEASAQLDQAPFIWAKYHINAAGYPDSMENYMQGLTYRKEVFTYASKGQLSAVEVFNHKNESVHKELVENGKKGTVNCLVYSKGRLKSVRVLDKSNRVIQSKIYTDARIYGYDSLVYFHNFEADTSSETYFLNGLISHQLTKKWMGVGPDSFHQAFYQSNAESGRMPSYSAVFPVNDEGSLVVPDDLAFGEMFKSISYHNRFERYIAFDKKLSELLVVENLQKQSPVVEQKRTHVTLRHFYTFDYAVK